MLKASKPQTQILRTLEGQMTVNYIGVSPLRIRGGNVTKQQYADKIKSYILPGEKFEFYGDTVTVTGAMEGKI